MEVLSSPVMTLPATPSAGLVIKTLVLTDLVGSTALFEKIGDTRASELSTSHDRLVRDLVAELDGREIDKTDGFLLLFERPVEGVRFTLAYHRALGELAAHEGVRLRARAAVHLGEVALRENPAADVARGAKPLEVEGTAKALVARLAALAQGGQTLLSRAAFDLARRGTVGTELLDPSLRWLSHGPYLLKGFDDPLEIFEVGVAGAAPLAAPPGSEKARRAVRAGDEITLGWRAAQGQAVPRRPGWRLRKKLAEGGFGDVWLAVHEKTGEKRVFKFCYDAERLRALRREVALFRLLREGLGHRDDIGRILDWNFDEAPYSLELDYSAGGNLADWAAEQGGLGRVPLAVRLELVAQVAEALDAAHSVGILHKDVKPANVLVAGDRDGRRQAVLTDFGIGTVTDHALLAASGITVSGMTAMLQPSTGGTQIYMAPELLEGRPASIQSDLYALGVMLYQMAVGDLSRVLAPGWDRDVDDEILREDVAAIVDGSPERRPRSGGEVAQRLRRLDARRAEREAARQACRETERARRTRRVLAVVAGVATVFLAVVSLLALRAVEARREAQQRRLQAENLIDFMLFDLRDRLESIGRLDLLAKVAEKSQEYFRSVPEEDRIPGRRRAVALLNIGDVWIDQGETGAALEAYQEAAEIFAARAAAANDRESAIDLARARLKWGEALRARGQVDAGLGRFGEARDELERLATGGGDGELRLLLAHARYELGKVLWYYRKSADARPTLEAARDLADEMAAEANPEARWRALEVAIDARHVLGQMALALFRDSADALASYGPALEAVAQLAAEDPANLNWRGKEAAIRTSIGSAYVSGDDSSAALAAFLKARDIYKDLTEDDPTNLRWREGVARSLMLAGESQPLRPAAALELQRAALDICRDLEARDPDEARWRLLAGFVHGDLGDTLLRLEQPRQALVHYETAVDVLSERVKQDPEDLSLKTELCRSEIGIGQAYAAVGQTEAAATAWGNAVRRLEPAVGTDSAAFVLDTYARALVLLDRLDEAAPVLRTLAERGQLGLTLRELLDKKSNQSLHLTTREGAGHGEP